jgi:signal transduction histidine kinase
MMKSSFGHRRGLAHRPFLLLGLLLLLPAVGFGLLGWRSVLREKQFDAREAQEEAEDAVQRRLGTLALHIKSLEATESEQPYFHYQSQFAPEHTAFQQLDFQPSPLTEQPKDPLVIGYFQWEYGVKGVPQRPETFGPGAKELAAALVAPVAGTEGYGAYLRAQLARAESGTGGFLGGVSTRHALRVVQANEERGQLYEEIQIAQQQGGSEPASNIAPSTPYLESFRSRVGDDPVSVDYGAFRYVAIDAPGATVPLVAWRVVKIPAVFSDRREVTRDRWLLQGYALDAGRSLPTGWVRVGKVRLRRADRVSAEVLADPRKHEASLLDLLNAVRLGGVGSDAPAGSALGLVAVPDPDALGDEHASARARFFWLLAGVVVIVAVGFVVLTRGMRREIALAHRKEDFLAAVTHELKTPLTGIRMYADMLREGWVADTESAERYATRIVEESDRLGHLVTQVLDLAAWERGVAKIDLLPGHLEACVEKAVSVVTPRAEQAGVKLDLRIEDDLPSIPLDPRLVEPLVLNLLDNAIKYSEHAADKVVRVDVRRADGRVVLEIEDHGVGIDPKIRRRLFEPFQRAGDEMTRSSKGVGIGLALVKRYADAHGAKVSLESELGKGTTVRVRFPRS